MSPEDRLVILREAMTDAVAWYWRQRARGYAERGHDEIARACRARAAVALMGDDPEVEALLADPGVVGDVAKAHKGVA